MHAKIFSQSSIEVKQHLAREGLELEIVWNLCVKPAWVLERDFVVLDTPVPY